jgi:hypothetical protein
MSLSWRRSRIRSKAGSQVPCVSAMVNFLEETVKRIWLETKDFAISREGEGTKIELK